VVEHHGLHISSLQEGRKNCYRKGKIYRRWRNSGNDLL